MDIHPQFGFGFNFSQGTVTYSLWSHECSGVRNLPDNYHEKVVMYKICWWLERQLVICDIVMYKVEKPKRVSDHYRCTSPRVEGFLCGPKMANCKSGGLKHDAIMSGMQWLAKKVVFHTTCDPFWLPLS